MNDKELADKVVALGVGSLLPAKNKYGVHVRSYPWYEINDDEFVSGSTAKSAKQFVRDWRVAGSLMEKVDWAGANIDIEKWSTGYEVAIDGSIYREDESLPRAIIAACTEALVESKCLRIKRSGLN